MNKKVRIAVLVSGGGTNLQALIDAQAEGKLSSGEIKLVIASNNEAYALKRAENNGIKTAVAVKKNCPQDEFEKKILDILDKNNIDMIILAGFMCILSADFISKWSRRIINVHPSLIPSFCGKGCYGLHVHEKALDYGVKVTGATVHFVNEIPDGGEIIFQKAVNVEDGDTPEILQKRVMEQAEWIILPAAAEKVAAEIAEKGDNYGRL